MRKKIATLLLLTSFCSLFAASSCQQHNMKIEGTCEHLQDGDTLFLTNDLNRLAPIDTAIVKDGHFSFSSEADSVFTCLLFNRQHELYRMFIAEPGHILLSLTANDIKVAGTPANDQLQQMNEQMASVSKQMSAIYKEIQSPGISAAEIEAKKTAFNKLGEQMEQIVKDHARKHAGTNFGFILLSNYSELFEPQELEELMAKLPANLRQRSIIKRLAAEMEAQKKTAEGSPMGDFTQNDLQGNPQSLMAEVKKHKVTIIDFWASWCGPCRADMPGMVSLYAELKDKGLGIIGISFDNNHDSWSRAVKDLGMTWMQVSDLQGWQNSIGRHFSVNSIPHTMVVDQKGIILKKGLRGEELSNYVRDLLK